MKGMIDMGKGFSYGKSNSRPKDFILLIALGLICGLLTVAIFYTDTISQNIYAYLIDRTTIKLFIMGGSVGGWLTFKLIKKRGKTTFYDKIIITVQTVLIAILEHIVFIFL